MEEYGRLMKREGISHIYFVHGTWVGDSPLVFLSRNAIETVLGHGLYTCKKKMLFNTELIVDNFYKD